MSKTPWNKGLTKETDSRVAKGVRRGADHPMFKGGRKLHKGYWYIHKCVVPNKFLSMVDKGDRVLEHRLVYAQHIGRPLLSSELVHHKDENKLNNDISNLELTNKAEHSRHHLRGNDYGKLSKKYDTKCVLCGSKHRSKGLCSKCYAKFWRRGTMNVEDVERYVKVAPRAIANEISLVLSEKFPHIMEEFIQR